MKLPIDRCLLAHEIANLDKALFSIFGSNEIDLTSICFTSIYIISPRDELVINDVF